MDTSRSETDDSGIFNTFGRSMYMKNIPLSSNNMGGQNHITFKFIDRLLQHFKFITFKFIVLFSFMNVLIKIKLVFFIKGMGLYSKFRFGCAGANLNLTLF
ncbi:hypothetical protein AHAS_Ahas13G0066600 [Arachis hypogaea]